MPLKRIIEKAEKELDYLQSDPYGDGTSILTDTRDVEKLKSFISSQIRQAVKESFKEIKVDSKGIKAGKFRDGYFSALSDLSARQAKFLEE